METPLPLGPGTQAWPWSETTLKSDGEIANLVVETTQGLAWVLSVFLICSLVPGRVLGRDDPLEVLCFTYANVIGDIYLDLKEEPMIQATVIPSTEWLGYGMIGLTTDQVRKYIRRYFPRTYEELTRKYEFILLYSGGAHLDFSYFTSSQVGWMGRAIEEAGLGGLQDKSVTSGLTQYGDQWAQTSLSEVFPNDADAVLEALAEDAQLTPLGPGKVTINDDPILPRVLSPYEDLLDQNPWTGMAFLMIPREGSQIYAWLETHPVPGFAGYLNPGIYPYVLGWRYGKGYTWSLAEGGMQGMFRKQGVCEEGPYVYGHDAFFGMLMYSTGRNLPEDVVTVHQLKECFAQYREAAAFVYSLVDFVEKFGANTKPLLEKAALLEGRWEEGRRLYLAQEWDDSRAIMEGLTEDVRLFTEETLKFKDRALLWAYVTEWASVTATFLGSGFILWTLMVKRRFFREIDQTRLRPPPGEMGAEFPECTNRKPYSPWWGSGKQSRLAVS